MLDIVVPLELASALSPPFTIAVAIVLDRPGLVPGRSTPDRERETADLYWYYISGRSQGSVQRDAGGVRC